MAGLESKKLGIFTCGMKEGIEGANQLDSVFPEELVKIAKAKENFGGKFVFKRMSFIEKMIIRVVAKTKDDASTVDNSKIKRFAKEISKTSLD